MQTFFANPNPKTTPGTVRLQTDSLSAPQLENNENGDNRALVNALMNSKIYKEYERAFSDMTGMPVALQPVESWQLPHHGKRNENRLCALMSEKSNSCAACLQMQEELCRHASDSPQSLTCEIGLCDTAVPVRLSNRIVGYLQTGQIFRKKPTLEQFERALEKIREWGIETDREKLKEAFFAGKVMTPRQHESATKLLSIFAQHLALLSNQVFIQQENSESPVIARARNYIHEHQAEELSLGQVAKAVNMSSFYFCKMFKKVSGINFTAYVARVRIEKSKNLLLNPNLRVSEIAFEVGFQSLTHFNRVFKKLIGQSPTKYRSQLTAH
jgi:AraC-like DNA-binding protein